MSKSTKIIAALGVAAGLGVAALPAATFAADTSIAVPLRVTVDPQLSIAVSNSGDFVTPANNENKGLVLAAGATDERSTSQITAISNNGAGYNVSVKSTTTGSATLTGAEGNTFTIAPFSGDGQAADSFSDLTSVTGWGIRLNEAIPETDGSSDYNVTNYKGVSDTASRVLYASHASGSASAKATVFTVRYGVALASNANADTYNGSITYTISNGTTAPTNGD